MRFSPLFSSPLLIRSPPNYLDQPADFAHEIAGSLRFFVDYARGKPGTHGPRVPSLEARNGQKPGTHMKMNFGEAFGLAPRPYARAATGMSASAASYEDSGSGHGPSRRGTGQGNAGESVSLGAVRARGESLDERERLAPYQYEDDMSSSGHGGRGY